MADLEQENRQSKSRLPQQDQVSTTDPDSRPIRPRAIVLQELGYFNNLSDRQPKLRDCGRSGHCRPLEPGKCGGSRDDHAVSGKTRALPTVDFAADTTYGNGELLAWFEENETSLPYIRVKESPAPKTNLYGIGKFIYDRETNSYQCPAGKRLTYLGVNPRNRNHIYRATWKR